VSPVLSWLLANSEKTMSFYQKLTPEEKAEIKKQKQSNRNRKRSRNAFIDAHLNEEKGDDDFADLEDWIV
jgi:hypothetical protein